MQQPVSSTNNIVLLFIDFILPIDQFALPLPLEVCTSRDKAGGGGLGMRLGSQEVTPVHM